MSYKTPCRNCHTVILTNDKEDLNRIVYCDKCQNIQLKKYPKLFIKLKEFGLEFTDKQKLEIIKSI